MDILQVFEKLSHVDCQSMFRNGGFHRVVWRIYWRSVISEIHQLWLPSFFCSTLDVDSRNGTKNPEKVFRFSDSFILIQSGKFSECSIGYLASAVIVLRNTNKISRKCRGDVFEINFTQNDEKHDKIALNGHFASIRDTFTCWLSKRVPKRCFLEKSLTKFFTVCNFRNTLGMTIIFFLKVFKIWCSFQKWKKKFKKVMRFIDNYIWIGSCKLSQSSMEYLPSAVNVLTNTLKILHNTRGDIFRINLSQNDENMIKVLP